jgi:hypothetical protein
LGQQVMMVYPLSLLLMFAGTGVCCRCHWLAWALALFVVLDSIVVSTTISPYEQW